MFSDDTKAYKDVQTEENMLILQKDVDSLFNWSLKWQLKFNATKCTHMTYGNPNIRSKYKMNEGDGKLTDIRHDDEVEKDLGGLFDRDLSFRQHIWMHSEEGKSDDWSDKAHFPLHGPRSISAFVYFIDETAHGLRGLHLESASEGRYCPARKCTEKSDTIGTRP